MDQLTRCRPLIENALKHSGNTHDFIDVAEGVYKGLMQLWPLEKSCIVTEIISHPQKKVLHIFLGAGDLTEILSIHLDVLEFAKSQGCTAVSMNGRKGWQKALKKYNIDVLHVAFWKDI